MRELFSRRDVLRLGLHSGLALSPLGLLGCGSGGGGDGSPGPGPDGQNPGTDPGYRALVCVFLLGGNDAYNTLVPRSPERHAQYAQPRPAFAIARGELLALNGTAADGAAYGLHPSCPELAQLFNDGHAAIVANVGSLLAPTTRADFLAGRHLPARLFSHNDQQDEWQSAQADGRATSGWAGRLADVLSNLNPTAELPLNISLNGTNLMQTGVMVNPLRLIADGPSGLEQLAASPLRDTYDRLRRLPHGHVFERAYADSHERGIALHEELRRVLDATPAIATAFPANNPLSLPLRKIAHLISARDRLRMKRQVFFVAVGTWDHHDRQGLEHPRMLRILSSALAAFHQATIDLGVAQRVTTFTASDFGRTLTVNGKGTDHGWSGHHFVVGGSVRGGSIIGRMPSLEVDGADDTRGGRFIPAISVDEYAASFARWLGVGDRDLGYVLPNLGRFETRGLDLLR